MGNNTTGSARRRREPDQLRITIKGAWTAIPNRLLLDKRLSRDARLLGSMLFLHAGNAGVAFPSQEQLADEMSTAERTIVVRSIQRWLTELREAGWLNWRQTLRNNEYTLLDPTERAPDAAYIENDAPSDSSDTNASTGTTVVSSRATEGSPSKATQRSGGATQESPSKTTRGSSSNTTQRSAPTIAVSPHTTAESCSTFINRDSLDSDSSSSESRPTHHSDDDDTSHRYSTKKPRVTHPSNQQTETARYLAEHGISAAREFCELPLSVAQRTWQEITSRDPEARPGAVVQALRAWVARPTQHPTPNIGTSHGPIDVDRYTNGHYGDLFRRGGDACDSAVVTPEEDLP